MQERSHNCCFRSFDFAGIFCKATVDLVLKV